MTTLKEIIKHCNDLGEGIRAVSVTDKVQPGKLSVFLGHLLINPEDYDKLEDKTCKYKVIDRRNEM